MTNVYAEIAVQENKAVMDLSNPLILPSFNSTMKKPSTF